MRTIATGVVTGLLCLGGLVAEAEAKQKAYQVMADAMTFALHDAAFTMYHEVGHLLVGELGLPVLGKEEDAVDAWATIWLLEFDEAEDSDEDKEDRLQELRRLIAVDRSGLRDGGRRAIGPPSTVELLLTSPG